MKITHHAVTVLTVAVTALATASVAVATAAAATNARQPGTTTATAATAARPASAVPANFQPATASFWSAARGVVLGSVGCHSGRACPARLAATTDGGAHWHFLPTPHVWVANHKPVVARVVFANRNDGWLYGQALWATHDGGRHWRKLSMPGGIEAMAASHGSVYAVAGPSYNKPWKLYMSPAGRNAWARVGHMTGKYAALAVSGPAVWFGTSTHLWVTPDGTRWHKYPFSCPNSQYKTPTSLASIAAASRSRVAFLCLGDSGQGHESKVLTRSVNGGKTAHLAGYPPLEGVGGVIAVPPHHPRVIALGSTYILSRSADGGETWARKFFNSGGFGCSYLSYQTATVGWSVFGAVTSGELLQTSDTGRTWHEVSF